MKTNNKPKENAMTPLTKEQVSERLEAILALGKRIPKVCQELEVEGLDMIMYSRALADGKFPATHLVVIENALTKQHTEVGRIIKAFKEIFDKEIGEKNGHS